MSSSHPRVYMNIHPEEGKSYSGIRRVLVLNDPPARPQRGPDGRGARLPQLGGAPLRSRRKSGVVQETHVESNLFMRLQLN